MMGVLFNILQIVIRNDQRYFELTAKGVGLYQEELADLPWKARQEIMETLQERGEHVCSNYSLEERIISLPAQLI
jgi:hypothetical protein